MQTFVAFLLLALVLALGLPGCASEEGGRDDSELGNLVVSPKKEIVKVDLGKASTELNSFWEALHLPHSWIGDSLGPHLVQGHSKVSVQQGDTELENLDDTLFLELDSKQGFHLKLDNSKEYGRHVIFTDALLYLRPRFGKYHQRPPQTETEAKDIRNQVFAGSVEYLDLFSGQLQIAPQGKKSMSGRSVQVILLSRSKENKHRSKETKAHKAWRNTIEVQTIEGQASLDEETGALMHLQFQGVLHFVRDKKRFTMTISAEQSISDVGHKRIVAPPESKMNYPILPRRHELDERNHLLKGIAPPAQKAPTPKPTRQSP